MFDCEEIENYIFHRVVGIKYELRMHFGKKIRSWILGIIYTVKVLYLGHPQGL